MKDIRVCEKWFPNEKGFAGKSGFPMNPILKSNLDILLKNLPNDWDFTILISGGGEVRVGKSMIAMQIASYCAYVMQEKYGKKTLFNLNNSFVFEGTNLIHKGHYLGANYPYSPLVFDEAGADLEGRKVTRSSTKLVLDYFRECGQYNLVNILVIPEFFDLPKGIALSRSAFLIDVYYRVDKETGKFVRGYFNFYNRRKKKKLYLKGKKELNYQASIYDFNGRFYNFYPIDEQEYRDMKQQALIKRSGEEKLSRRDIHLLIVLKILRDEIGMTYEKIMNFAKKYGETIGINTLTSYYRKIPKKKEVLTIHS